MRRKPNMKENTTTADAIDGLRDSMNDCIGQALEVLCPLLADMICREIRMLASGNPDLMDRDARIMDGQSDILRRAVQEALEFR